MVEHERIVRLTESYRKISGEFDKTYFQKALFQEILQSTLSETEVKVTQRWNDLKELGVLDECWDNLFPNCKRISLQQFLGVFEQTDGEKLFDLCSEDQSLLNQIFDLEECLQSSKDMLAATDLLLEERTERNRVHEEELKLQKQKALNLLKEVENLRTKVKNVESEHRLLKRDFDLVFATNKSVQKKMEKAELENRALRKTIIALANQMEKIEREHKKELVDPCTKDSKEVLGMVTNHFVPESSKSNVNEKHCSVSWNREKQSHLYVWDPAVRSLVPIRNNLGRKKIHQGT